MKATSKVSYEHLSLGTVQMFTVEISYARYIFFAHK